MSHEDSRSPEEARHDLAAADRFRQAATPALAWWYPPLTSALTAGTFVAFAVGRKLDDGTSWGGTAAYGAAVLLGLALVVLTGRTEGRRGVIAAARRTRPAAHTALAFAAALVVGLIAAVPDGFPGFLAAGGVALGVANWWSFTGRPRTGAGA